ncbi:hypothetical protein V494_00524 [Pseudogymnoascus sp. VKM F-4513 (FW-928)]|nr:hypothetical protein V494_00524 [Pseudogymnoascus sp. VKM F-4513 (FW-928)]
MFKSILLTTASLLLLSAPVHAVCGIHTFGHCEDNITHLYDPLTGEICDPLDCGGGRAPPKTDVPGCGTIPLPPNAVSYLSCWTPGFTGAPGPPVTVVKPTPAETTAEAAPVITAAESSFSLEATTVGEVQSTKETTAAAAAPSTEESKEATKASSTLVTSTKPASSSAPETTLPAVLPPTEQTGAKNGTVTSSEGSSAEPTTIVGTGAGAAVKGSVMAVVGAVVGVVVLV